MKYKITYAEISNIGKRSVNEDSIGHYDREDRKGFILCDGLGGHGMGDAASSLVRDVFVSQFEKMENIKEFGNIFAAAQDILMTEQIRQKAQKKMKTTAVALVTDGKKAYIGHVGDSRLYVFGTKGLMKRTKDHSIVQMLVETKDIKESEIRNHPDRSVLLKVMGIEWDEPMYELQKPISLRKCKAFLMCSDGFWELLSEEEMTRTLEEAADVSEWLERMNQIVQENGKNTNMDNNSAIAVFVNRE